MPDAQFQPLNGSHSVAPPDHNSSNPSTGHVRSKINSLVVNVGDDDATLSKKNQKRFRFPANSRRRRRRGEQGSCLSLFVPTRVGGDSDSDSDSDSLLNPKDEKRLESEPTQVHSKSCKTLQILGYIRHQFSILGVHRF